MNVYFILFCLWGGEGLLNLGVAGPSSYIFLGKLTQKRQSLVSLGGGGSEFGGEDMKDAFSDLLVLCLSHGISPYPLTLGRNFKISDGPARQM